MAVVLIPATSDPAICISGVPKEGNSLTIWFSDSQAESNASICNTGEELLLLRFCPKINNWWNANAVASPETPKYASVRLYRSVILSIDARESSYHARQLIIHDQRVPRVPFVDVNIPRAFNIRKTCYHSNIAHLDMSLPSLQIINTDHDTEAKQGHVQCPGPPRLIPIRMHWEVSLHRHTSELQLEASDANHCNAVTRFASTTEVPRMEMGTRRRGIPPCFLRKGLTL